MIILKYERTGRAAFLPHLDVLRLFGRICRRAGFKVNFSEGYNPHMLFFFGNPMSLGISSLAEYCAVDSPEEPAEFLRRFREKSVDGLRPVKAAFLSKNPNFADILCAAEYRIVCPGVGSRAAEMEALARNPAFTVEYPSGKKKPAADKLLSLEIGGEELTVRLKSGRENLKADEWMNTLSRTLRLVSAFSLTRTRQFFQRGEELADADELFLG